MSNTQRWLQRREGKVVYLADLKEREMRRSQMPEDLGEGQTSLRECWDEIRSSRTKTYLPEGDDDWDEIIWCQVV